MSISSHSKPRSYKGSFNSSINSKKVRDNILNTKFSVNSNFLNKLKLKNLNNLVKRTAGSQKGIKRVISYQSKNKQNYTSNQSGNSKMLHLTLNSNPLGTNVVQINNYVSANSKMKDNTGPSLSKAMSGSRIPKKSSSVRKHKVSEVIRRTGYRDTNKLNKYRKILIDGYKDDTTSKLSKKSTTGSRKRTAHAWKTQFDTYNK